MRIGPRWSGAPRTGRAGRIDGLVDRGEALRSRSASPTAGWRSIFGLDAINTLGASVGRETSQIELRHRGRAHVPAPPGRRSRGRRSTTQAASRGRFLLGVGLLAQDS